MLVSRAETIDNMLMAALSFGEWLRREREGRGLSLEALGEKVNFGKAYISKIEGRRAAPPLKTIAKITKALELPIVEPLKAMGLIDDESEAEHDPRLLFHFRQLPPEGKDIAVDIMDVLWRRFYNPKVELHAVAGDPRKKRPPPK